MILRVVEKWFKFKRVEIAKKEFSVHRLNNFNINLLHLSDDRV